MAQILKVTLVLAVVVLFSAMSNGWATAGTVLLLHADGNSGSTDIFDSSGRDHQFRANGNPRF